MNVKNLFANSTQEIAVFEITVVNEPNFEYDVIYNEKVRKQKELEEQRDKQNKYNFKAKKAKPVEIDRQEEDPTLPAAFFCLKDNIRIRKGQTAELSIQYMPFTLTTHKCKIIFTDPSVGEFQYNVIGEAMLPDPLAEIKMSTTLYVDTPFVIIFIFYY